MPPEVPLIADRASAEAFLAKLRATMGELEALLARESAGVRAGRLRESMAESAAKTALAAAYMTGLEAAKANVVALKRFAPAALDALRSAQAAFARALEANQAVLATARAVSEGLIRTLADEIGRARTPSVYGTPASAPSPYGRGPTRGGPLVVSKSL